MQLGGKEYTINTSARRTQSTAAQLDLEDEEHELESIEGYTASTKPREQYPSPLPERALHSAKLAALHARLSLPQKLPLQTMARTLVDPSADPNPHFNNASLAQLGSNLTSYHTSEHLLCTYPRLPQAVLFASAHSYAGPTTLHAIAREWGVEEAAAPGGEVDPGLLQFSHDKAEKGKGLATSFRKDLPFYRRGLSSRNVYDDEFGDKVAKRNEQDDKPHIAYAYANFVQAVIGALHDKFICISRTRERSLKTVPKGEFRLPGRETVDGRDKLGEGAGASLNEAKTRASVAALKAWYLYSPGPTARVPSDMEIEEGDARPWEPVHIDIGEVV
ncbi:hypothetical protein B7494_g6112 [Chlorociboria aeruginascens]|nr:hypothetical protein B7494_g6112 [Chlorociboria aeruginascens]